ncbi:hypothetical protein A3D80_04760 [Candidatus Roizmanbacteria bacterium RIFCSPHIGHO2_02_FULL_40_13b]|nr:MAG: hypothetical protein A3D80_04760 [Candidatus Roizmanbacteria bacterium RIFCSPHIGHO2_02_FULL_40_13b]OGK50299.1 MAG: hypothetical protein A3A56_04410 [Candidatus Roizmanbacteria bacterium RIFCSPLOWO2_01_FULL_40_32]
MAKTTGSEGRQDNLEVEGQLPTEAEIMAGQVELIKEILVAINLPYINVEDEVQVRDASYYRDKPTVGFLSLREDTVAVLASCGSVEDDPDRPTTILITPGSAQGSLKRGRISHKPYADFFFALEEDTIVAVKTTEPIPVDVLYPGFSYYHFGDFDPETTLADRVSHDLTCLKANTFLYSEEYEIPTPRGVLVPKGHSVSLAVRGITQLEYLRGVVVKDPDEHQSKGVRMYDLDETGLENAKAYAEEVIGKAGRVIIEERVIPANIHFSPKEHVDWNVRAIAFVDGDSVAYVGSIIRYSTMGGPVSISTGGYTMPLPETSWLGAYAKDFTSDVMGKIAQAIRDTNGDPKGIFGLDIIFGIHPEGGLRPVIIEPNGWHVGGMSEMCQMNGNTLDAISQRVIPALTPRVMRNFENREVVDDLEDVQVPDFDFSLIIEGVSERGEHAKARELLQTRKEQMGKKEYWRLMTNLHTREGNTGKADASAAMYESI